MHAERIIYGSSNLFEHHWLRPRIEQFVNSPTFTLRIDEAQTGTLLKILRLKLSERR